MTNFNKIMFYSTMMVGTLITISSNSWLGMWLGLEINLLSLIPLLSFPKTNLSSESSLKYFITQTLASLILIQSILTLNLTEMVSYIEMSKASNILMMTSLLTKMGAAPFHFWLPEMIEGLTWLNSFLIMTWQKIAPMTILMLTTNPPLLMSLASIWSILISGVMGLNQTSLRKIMAYSSINHLGWMLNSFILMENLWLWYMIIYSMLSGFIMITFNLLNINLINQISSSIYPVNLKILFSMNMFSLGGLPPFIGFLPKWMVIQIMIKSKLILPSLLMILLTLLTLYFYMRIAISPLLMKSFLTKKNYTKMPFKLILVVIINFTMVVALLLASCISTWV
uniref:NADH-ubiquinone oxidoreductase chain 2 n=1 Tax=Endelus continentalis TaxID=2984121 RepID=A0A977TPZ6_9COLE|nr:NADH dehydrogenase subunit 2 [Endelus continentalis]UXX50471.1 NADH dehydrogenase subunit 2 [Endelus continentalis]